jgi:hypothetical protein
VTSSVTDYYEENGRRYHAFREGRESRLVHPAIHDQIAHLHAGYLLPNDEKESERLDIHHALITTAMDDRLFYAPIGDKPQRVIDICTGTGIWAIEFGIVFLSSCLYITALATNNLTIPQRTNFHPPK